MGQDLGEYGGRGGGGECGDETKQLLFLSLKSPQLLWRYERGHSHVEFFTGTFIATPSPETKIACKTFALKERLAIIGRLLCFVAQILLLTFLTGSK